jgi:hypothetical protein
MKIAVLWNVTLFSFVDVHRLFGGAYCIYPQGGRASQASKKYE